MKSVFLSRFCLALLLCAALCLPAAQVCASALPDYTTAEYGGAVYGIPAMALTNDCTLLSAEDQETLTIPGTGAGLPGQGEVRLPATRDESNPIVTGASFVLAFGMAFLLTRKKRRR